MNRNLVIYASAAVVGAVTGVALSLYHNRQDKIEKNLDNCEIANPIDQQIEEIFLTMPMSREEVEIYVLGCTTLAELGVVLKKYKTNQ